MNILIKNADFSEVSIGQIRLELQPVSTVSHATIRGSDPIGRVQYASSALICLVYDISDLQAGDKIKVTGFIGTQKMIGSFFPNTAPTEDYVMTSSSSSGEGSEGVYNQPIGTPIPTGCSFPDASGLITKELTIPANAKTFILNGGSTSLDELVVEKVL